MCLAWQLNSLPAHLCWSRVFWWNRLQNPQRVILGFCFCTLGMTQKERGKGGFQQGRFFLDLWVILCSTSCLQFLSTYPLLSLTFHAEWQGRVKSWPTFLKVKSFSCFRMRFRYLFGLTNTANPFHTLEECWWKRHNLHNSQFAIHHLWIRCSSCLPDAQDGSQSTLLFSCLKELQDVTT